MLVHTSRFGRKPWDDTRAPTPEEAAGVFSGGSGSHFPGQNVPKATTLSRSACP